MKRADELFPFEERGADAASVELLSRGASVPETVRRAGYADQAHLTRSLRRFVGQTPTRVLAGRLGKPSFPFKTDPAGWTRVRHRVPRDTDTEVRMGAICVHEFMSLDGVIDTPTWTFDYGFDPKMGERLAAVTDRCQGILLGRTTFEMFAQAWPNRTAKEDPGAPFFNDTTKYVVSGTLTNPESAWRNSEVVGPYDPAGIRRLKEEVDGDLYTSGSGTLVRAMLADGLVDELHLCVYPLTRGSGPRLFAEGAAAGKLSLAVCESYENGVVYLAYRRP